MGAYRAARWAPKSSRASLINRFTELRSASRESSESDSLRSCIDATVGRPRYNITFTPEFYPDHPQLLKIGTRCADRSPVWIKFLLGPTRVSRVLKAELKIVSVKKIVFVWHARLELNLLEGDTKRETETSRRSYLATIIDENILKHGDSLSNSSKILSLGPTVRRRSTFDYDVSDTETSAVSEGAHQ